jgi:MoxR-like ATPase
MAKIVITRGPMMGREFNLPESGMRIGRNRRCGLVLTDYMASGEHAELRIEAGQWWLNDLNSTNGTGLNGTPVRAAVVEEGDTITIGETAFVFYAHGNASPTAAPETGAAKGDTVTPLSSMTAVVSPRKVDSATIDLRNAVGPLKGGAEGAPAAAAVPGEGGVASGKDTSLSSEDDLQTVAELNRAYREMVEQLGKVIVGQRDVIEQLLICIFCRGHALLVGVPGLAKTLLVSTLGHVLDLSFKRVQFTPDLMPSDITGTDVLEENRTTGKREMHFVQGPVFANLLLADEINRTPPKTQAALLEAMQEHRVTVGNETYHLPEPFFVLATQNPIEQEGTYPLPEAQLDRFMFNIVVDYPSAEEEDAIISQVTAPQKHELRVALTGADVLRLQQVVLRVPTASHVVAYARTLVRATRPKSEDAPDFVREMVAWGAGPRAGIYLILAAKAHAILHGRYHATTRDVTSVALPVLRHRVLTTFNAEAAGVTSDEVIVRLIKTLAPKDDLDV